MNVGRLDLLFAQGASSSFSGRSDNRSPGAGVRSHNLDPKLSIFLPMLNQFHGRVRDFPAEAFINYDM
jgi:hypothetical protein